jgi:sugar phosphate isomerase/epimerase
LRASGARFTIGGMKIGVTAVMLPELDFPDQVALCASLGVQLYQYRPRYIPAGERGRPFSPWGSHRFDLTPERLEAEGAALTASMASHGVRPWGTLPETSSADTDEAIELHVRGAAASRAGRIRLSPGPYPGGIFDYAAWLDGTVARYRAIIESIARPQGIKLVIETHAGGGAASPGLAWNIVHHFAPREVGVIFDLGNFAREGELPPRLAVSVLRDWIDCVHVGGSRRRDAGRDPRGWRRIAHESCPLADSDLPVAAWIDALGDAGVAAPLVVEDFAPDGTGAERLAADVAFLKALGAGT